MKMRRFLIVSAVLAALFALPSSAALTPAQGQTLLSFARRFIADGNALYLLQYGWDAMYHSVAGMLAHAADNWIDRGAKRAKIMVMHPQEGYPGAEEYLADVKRGGYFKEGDYFILDCTCFAEFMYKYVFGLRFDHELCGLVQQWTTSNYASNASLELERLGSRRKYRLFDTVLDMRFEEKSAICDALCDSSMLSAGDIIIGQNDRTGLGHIMFYSEDAHIIHSSSNAIYLPDGSVAPYTIAEVPISSLVSKYYDRVLVLRIADGILEEDFCGYDLPVDFQKLSLSKSFFDSTPPLIRRIALIPHKYKSGVWYLRVGCSDETGGREPMRLAHNSPVIIKSAGFGESGVCGICVKSDPDAPDAVVDFDIRLGNLQTAAVRAGEYYVWVRDTAENISLPWHVKISEDGELTVTPSLSVIYVCDDPALRMPQDTRAYARGDTATVCGLEYSGKGRFLGWRRRTWGAQDAPSELLLPGDEIEISDEHIILAAEFADREV